MTYPNEIHGASRVRRSPFRRADMLRPPRRGTSLLKLAGVVGRMQCVTMPPRLFSQGMNYGVAAFDQ